MRLKIKLFLEKEIMKIVIASLFTLLMVCGNLIADPVSDSHYVTLKLTGTINNVLPSYPLGIPAYFSGSPPIIPGTSTAYGISKTALSRDSNYLNLALFEADTVSNNSQALSSIYGYYSIKANGKNVAMSEYITNTVTFHDNSNKVGFYRAEVEIPPPGAGLNLNYKLTAHLDGYNYIDAWYDPSINKMRVVGYQRNNGVVLPINANISLNSYGTYKVFFRFSKKLTQGETAVSTTKLHAKVPGGNNLLQATQTNSTGNIKVSLYFIGYQTNQ